VTGRKKRSRKNHRRKSDLVTKTGRRPSQYEETGYNLRAWMKVMGGREPIEGGGWIGLANQMESEEILALEDGSCRGEAK